MVRVARSEVVVRPRPQPQLPVERPPDPPRIAARRQFEAEHPILVGELPNRPHALVRATRSGLRGLKEGSPERLHATGDQSLDLSVTAATRDRGLRILEALCRAFKQRGWPLTTRQENRRTSQIEVHGVTVAFSLEERLHRQERATPKPLGRLLRPTLFEERYEYVPTGELVLKAWHDTGSKHKWSDGKRERVEGKLNDFMLKAVCIADSVIRWQEERVIRERERREAEIARWKEEQLRQEEEHRIEGLTLLANSWRAAEDLRGFLTAVRRRVDAAGAPGADSQIERWLLWGAAYAERVDPTNRLGELQRAGTWHEHQLLRVS